LIIQDSSQKTRSSHSFSTLWSLPRFQIRDPPPLKKAVQTSSHSFSTLFYSFLFIFIYSFKTPPKNRVHHIHFQHSGVSHVSRSGSLLPPKKPFITFIFNTFLFIFIYLYSFFKDSSQKTRSSHSFSTLWSLPRFQIRDPPPSKTAVHHIHFHHFFIFFISIIVFLIQDSSPQKSRSSHSFSSLF
jgi:hypothetical protein